ncbi:RING-H2 finger protein ATL7-like [Cucurbita pepo subsp. pepo]|uniref:RING-H2 finger protein ATL7-like n=1 Tax=Cucurbita pepo subsp. pepo TaxID=3664 RepID=UPI000C9D5921|nr:RING-H2 finger protein ATL7-like [Cucurbita pepo subsp. pepo]
MTGSGMNFITTVVGFGMSATFIVFICTRIICGRLRSSQSNSLNYEIESRVDLEQQPGSRASGLEQVLIAAIPTMKFNREAFNSVEDAQCSICLGEYEEKEVLRMMPKCGHRFHRSCIDVWLRKQSTCPICRLPLQASSRTKPARPMTVSRDQSFDGSEISTDHHSQHWLLPGPNRSEGNTSNQTQLESVPVNSSVQREIETIR